MTGRFGGAAMWRCVRFQPILYFVLWFAAVRLAVTDGMPPYRITELVTARGEDMWLVTAVVGPPSALVAWWLVTRCRLRRSTLAGMWLRAGSDVGMLAVVMVYHLASVVTMPAAMRTETVFSRYVTASVMLFQMRLVIRDVVELVQVERLARRL